MSDAGDLALMMSAPDGAKMNRMLTGVMSKSFGAMPALVGIMQRYKCDNLLASQSRYVLLAGEMAGVCVFTLRHSSAGARCAAPSQSPSGETEPRYAWLDRCGPGRS